MITVHQKREFCACGAQWHGKYAFLAADVIAAHKERWRSGQIGCGQITHEVFRDRYRCGCDECKPPVRVRITSTP